MFQTKNRHGDYYFVLIAIKIYLSYIRYVKQWKYIEYFNFSGFDFFISKWTIPEYSTIDGKLSRIGDIGETETFIVP